jgi:hypothetical protein
MTDPGAVGSPALPAAPGPVPRRASDFWLRAGAIGGSLLLWLLACVLPALQLRTRPPGPDPGSWPGGALLGIGPLGPLVLQFAWYANLVLLAAFILLGTRKWLAASIVAAAGMVVALDTLALFVRPFPSGANREMYYLSRPLPGYYLWLASFVLVAACALAGLWRRSNEHTLMREGPSA